MPRSRVKPLLLVAALGGCITETTHATTQMTVAWKIELLDGTAVACPSDVARLIAVGDTTITSDLPCLDGIGVSAALPPGPYTFTLEILGYATSLPQDVDLTDGISRRIDAEIVTDGGYLRIDWAVDCTQVDYVQVTAGPYTDTFACGDHARLTKALPAGTYSVSVAAQRSGALVGSVTTLSGVNVLDKNRVTDLGVVPIAL